MHCQHQCLVKLDLFLAEKSFSELMLPTFPLLAPIWFRIQIKRA